MDRRGFLKLFTGAAVAAVAAEAIPFNRVWSFPSQIRIASEDEISLYTSDIMAATLNDFMADVAYENFFVSVPLSSFLKKAA